MIMDNCFEDTLFGNQIDDQKYENKKVDIYLELCENPERNKMFRDIINDWHSYIDAKDTCNRRVNWLVRNGESGEVLGAIGINSAVLALSSRDKFIGWTSNQRMANLNQVANNYRFAMIYRGLGSQVLSVLRKTAPIIWKEKYGDELVLLETLVKPPWEGTVYSASGWTKVGKTKGYSIKKLPIKLWKQGTGRRAELARAGRLDKYGIQKDDIVKVEETVPKLIFLKTLRRDWKKFLVR
jgi:hypothetical protein